MTPNQSALCRTLLFWFLFYCETLLSHDSQLDLGHPQRPGLYPAVRLPQHSPNDRGQNHHPTLYKQRVGAAIQPRPHAFFNPEENWPAQKCISLKSELRTSWVLASLFFPNQGKHCRDKRSDLTHGVAGMHPIAGRRRRQDLNATNRNSQLHHDI